jgi:multidrug efflux system membrane fusion protein
MKPVTLTLGALLVLGGAGAWAYQNRPEVVAPLMARIPGLDRYAPALPAKAATAEAGPAKGQTGNGRGGAPVSVTTASVEQRDFPIRRRSIGFIEPMATVVVKSRLDSQLLTQHVTDGQMVEQGELLFTLDDKELAAQLVRDEANLAKDQAVKDRTDADLKRKRELLSNNSGAQQQVDQAIADNKAAMAAVAADEAALVGDRLRLAYTKITAPIAGRVGTVQVTPGNLVRANDAGNGLVTITQVKPLRVAFTLPERELTRVRDAMTHGRPLTVRVSPSGTNKVLATSTVSFIDSTVDTASGTITVKAIFPNDDLTLWPGQYVDVSVDLDTVPGQSVIPTVALQTGQDSSYVFVVKPDKTVDLRKVTVLASDGERTAIATGLAPGEKVVVDGMMRLNNGSRVREAGEGPAKPGQAKPVAENEVRS